MATRIRYITEDELPRHPEHQVDAEGVLRAYVIDETGYKELVRTTTSEASLWTVDERSPEEVLSQEDWTLSDHPGHSEVKSRVTS